MTDLRQQTIDTYNNSAKELAEYFRGIGPRQKYIDFAFEAAGNPGPARVLEIGCGDGRDAEAIIKKAAWYLGIDISEVLIKLARQKVSQAHFEVADASTFNYPPDLDIVFAFASLLHLNQSQVSRVFQKVERSLRPGGVFYISLKWAPKYTEMIKEDKFGTRLFYFYNAELLQKLAGPHYEIVKAWKETIGHTEWLELALRKR